jgi:hypothetical protein
MHPQKGRTYVTPPGFLRSQSPTAEADELFTWLNNMAHSQCGDYIQERCATHDYAMNRPVRQVAGDCWRERIPGDQKRN